jgi:predicted TIM-barrel fold metal-dependent hydrolase
MTLASHFLFDRVRMYSVSLAGICASVLVALTLSVHAVPCFADNSQLARDVPIADVHMHLYKGLQPQELLEAMNRNNVRWGGGVGPLGPGYDPKDFSQLLGKRYFPAGAQAEYHDMFMSGGESEMTNPESPKFKALVDKLTNQFEKKEITGLGELILSNHNSSAFPAYRRKVRIDSEPFQILFRLAQKYQGFVVIHADDNSDSIAEITTLAKNFPSVPLILAHCVSGSSADTIRKLFEAFPNLYCETSYRSTARNSSPQLYASMIHTESSAKSDWIGLIEQMPDRFMVGSDFYIIAMGGAFAKDVSYDKVIESIRSGLLSQLKPETIKKLAYQNAQKLFNLAPIPGKD